MGRLGRALSWAAVLLVGMPLAATAQVEQVEDLRYPPLPEFEIPQPTKAVLDNGLTVLMLEDHELPLIEMTAMIEAGSRLEPADQVALAGLTAEVMRTGGTAEMTGDEIDDFLEARAASIELGAGESFATASLSVLEEDLDEVLPIFVDILRTPAFDEERLEVARKAVVAGIARQNDDPQQILFREFDDLIYGDDSPYARVPTYATAGSITRQDLIDFHRRHYHPNQTVLGVVGDFDPRRMTQLVRSAFGAWPRGPEAETAVAAPEEPVAAAGVYYAEKGDMTQSNIALGHLGIVRNHPDYHAVEVLNEVLSGGFASRLFSNVRSKKGLAYAVSGGVRSGWDHAGTMRMWMTTKTATTVAGIEALLEEARRLTSEPPTAEEVEKAKEAILASFIFNFDSREEILGRQVELAAFGYPLDWLQKYRDGIEAVTVEQVRAAAAKHVHPDRFRILVVGPSEGMDRPLSTLGEVRAIDISIPQPPTASVEKTAEGRARGAELIELAVEGMGGADVLAGLESTRVEASGTVTTPQGEMSLRGTTLVVYPDRMRQELSLPFGTIVYVLTPEASFLSGPMGTQEMPASQRQQVAEQMLRDPIVLLKHRGDEGFEAVASGQEEHEGLAVETVSVEFEGTQVTLGVAPENGHIVMQRFQGMAGGVPGEMVKSFADFREVDGLIFPFETSTAVDGEPTASSSVESLEVNVEVPPDAFARPAEETGGD